jgi:hypothetical protein
VTDGATAKVQSIIDRLTKWIPGEVITLYVAAVTAITTSKDAPEPSVGLLVLFTVAAGVVTILGAFSVSGTVPPTTFVSAILAVVAFLIWSVTVPFSGWQKIDYVRENPEWVTVIAGLAGLVFYLLAEGIEKAMARKPPS